jgi:leucyl aminopeptidase
MLLPSSATDLPRIELVADLLTPARFATLDAMMLAAPVDVTTTKLAALPDGARWAALHERSPAKPGTVRVTHLANPRQTLGVLGYVRADASSFERLTVAGRMAKELVNREARDVGLASLAADARDLEALLAASLAQSFQPPLFRSKRSREARLGRLWAPRDLGAMLERALASARGTNLVRWLTALPPNRLDAVEYRRIVARLARSHGLAMRWYDEATLRRLGAGAFLAVSAGNAARNAGIARLRYRPPRRRERAPDVALVGKGILFDTGGINLKPHRNMLDMHTDMAGSAVALATIIALAELEAPIAADAWLAITENRIGPTAYRPQDVVTAVDGTTIQVIHTDAEGRMVLADALALAAREKPRFALDFATLTGACVAALTERMSGVFTNEPRIAPALVEAGRASGERVWNFPMDEDYDTDLESRVADVVQCLTEGKGDHIYAARFLQRFLPPNTPWAHVDLTSAVRSGGLAHVTTDVTGFGVRYALELLLGQRVLDTLRTRR